MNRTSAIGPHLEQAISDLDQVDGSTPVVGGRLRAAKATALAYLTPLQQTYRTNEPLIRSLPGLVGANGTRTYLLAMLNPAEQRYSGGGALSFTTMRFDKGVATFGKSVNVDDVLAHGDQQRWTPVRGNTFHRKPPLRVTSSTFSPWWSVSGEELLRGYQEAFPGTHFDGMIGVDLQGLANLFRVTGPVDLPSFGQISADNLVSTLAGSYGNFDSIAHATPAERRAGPGLPAAVLRGREDVGQGEVARGERQGPPFRHLLPRPAGAAPIRRPGSVGRPEPALTTTTSASSPRTSTAARPTTGSTGTSSPPCT